MNKVLAIFFCVIICIAIFVACDSYSDIDSSSKDGVSQTSETLQASSITDESITLTDIAFRGTLVKDGETKEKKITKEYSLKELTGFFDKIYTNLFNGKQYFDEYYFDNVNQKFQIEFTREIDGYLQKNYYSVYKVKEGGYFYIFWDNQTTGNIETSARATIAYYIDEKRNCSLSELSALQQNKNSTLTDIAELTDVFEFRLEDNASFDGYFYAYVVCKEGFAIAVFENPTMDLDNMDAFKIKHIELTTKSYAENELELICDFVEEDLP
ncbi:MAG: hypothetical protein E7551_06520 [Ruminococcaceae bacterium]|nr:hypothetical protein [Oscillospiraceae bacterium]